MILDDNNNRTISNRGTLSAFGANNDENQLTTREAFFGIVCMKIVYYTPPCILPRRLTHVSVAVCPVRFSCEQADSRSRC